MTKKGVLIASAVAAALLLAGCSHDEQSMPQGPMAGQAGPSSKLGKMGTMKHHGYKAKKHKSSNSYY